MDGIPLPLWTLVGEHLHEVLMRSAEHLALCSGALAAACLLGIPAGIELARRPRLAERIRAASAAIHVVPSLALLAVLVVALCRLGDGAILVVLTGSALIPIARSTIAGISTTPMLAPGAGAPPLACATHEISWDGGLPLAPQALVGGLRTATTWTIGCATLCALVGGGGLGVFIVRGLASGQGGLILLGAVPVAALALACDAAFRHLLRRLDGGQPRPPATETTETALVDPIIVDDPAAAGAATP
jgi:osmoprotectant transport system permease protein